MEIDEKEKKSEGKIDGSKSNKSENNKSIMNK